MSRPRIFLGSSGKQATLLEAITSGLEDLVDVEPWTTTFNPGRSTLDRLVELSQEVDFAAFVFAQDDWTTTDASQSGQASPRDNVVFEAGLFGGALGMRRTFILHAHGSKLPSDLLGLTSVRYDPAASPAEVREINQKLRKAIETEGRRGLVEGLWWQLSLTERSEGEPSAVGLLRISRDRDGGLNVTGRAWQEDGTLSARYWSEAAKERRDPAGIFYFWKGERPRHPNAPQLEGTGEITVETADRATGYWTTRSDRDPGLNARTAGVYLRADPSDLQVLEGGERGGARPAHRAAPPGVEVGRERVLSAVPGSGANCVVHGGLSRNAFRRPKVARRIKRRRRAGRARTWSSWALGRRHLVELRRVVADLVPPSLVCDLLVEARLEVEVAHQPGGHEVHLAEVVVQAGPAIAAEVARRQLARCRS